MATGREVTQLVDDELAEIPFAWPAPTTFKAGSNSQEGRTMAKAKRKTRKAAKTELVENYVRPTPERIAHNDTQTAGMAHRITPVIDILKNAGKLDERRHALLGYYRDQCHASEDRNALKSPLSAERIMGGVSQPASGSRVPVSLLGPNPAMLEVGRIESDLGSLRDIAHAIAVQDLSLTAWCISQYGGRERYDSKGRFVAMVPNKSGVEEFAILQLKMAADRITY
jgi:hypothetical protein